jgi:glycosyltransferase involved in cell wall biosynthesis
MRLLESRGNQVFPFIDDNRRIAEMHPWQIATRALWSRESYDTFLEYIDHVNPHVCHFHNTLPLLSPSVYAACRTRGIPIVQTLHNYRLICVNAILYRDGHVCEDCVGKSIPWPGVIHACYRNDLPASGVVAAMLAYQKLIGSWSKNADIFVALTDFARDKFIQGGLPADRIRVKPNFITPDPGPGPGGGEFALFVGRLVPEKGLDTLLAAWTDQEPRWNLKIVGDGPMIGKVQRAAEGNARIEALGRIPLEEVMQLMKHAEALVLPSESYEGFPRTVVEAFSVGLPVIASDLGSLSTLISDGVNGLSFAPADPQALHDRVALLERDNQLHEALRAGSRRAYETSFSPESNYQMLLEIYREAISIVADNHS